MMLLDGKAALIRSVISLPGYTSAMGTRVLQVGQGVVVTALDKAEHLLQFNGYFHGGVISGLADHAAGAAVTTSLPDGLTAVTVDLHVNFLRPANGEAIVATARALQVGRTICVASVDVAAVTKEGELPCALATVTLRVVEMPAPPANTGT